MREGSASLYTPSPAGELPKPPRTTTDAPDLDVLEEEEEAAEHDQVPTTRRTTRRGRADASGASDPEEWDIDEEEGEAGEGPTFPKPERGFTPNRGPFAGENVESFVVTGRGPEMAVPDVRETDRRGQEGSGARVAGMGLQRRDNG